MAAFDDPVLVISLDRTPERWARFRADNPLIAAERVPAADGRALDRAALVAAGLLHPELDYSPGALGAAISHAELWRRVAETGRPLTICEDDAVLRPDFAAAARTVAKAAPGAELILWGWNFDSVLAGRLFGDTPFALATDQNRMRGAIDAFRAERALPAALRLHRAFGVPCYTLWPSGAETLIKRCFPLVPLSVYFPLLDREVSNTGVDIPMNAAYPAMAAYVSLPPLALTRNEARHSTIEES